MLSKSQVLSFVLMSLLSRSVQSANLSSLAQIAARGTLLRVLIDSVDDNISLRCRAALKQLDEGIAASEDWAIQMVDATAKLPSGILEGSITYLGSYDECLNITTLMGNEMVTGQYCPVTLKPVATNNSEKALIEINFRWDLCVPSLCTPQDLTLALSSISEHFAVSPQVSSCSLQTPKVIDTAQIVSLVMLSLLASLLISGTVFDVVCQMRNSMNPDDHLGNKSTMPKRKIQIFLKSFSMYSNACRLLDTSSGSGNLSALNGIRVLSTFWIIVGHSYYYIDWALVGNSKQAVDVRFSLLFQAVMNFSVTVDTFFFISGLLVVYSNLKKLSKSASINWFQFYFHRYWRLTPPVAILILFLLLWPLMGSGPYWNTATAQAAYCRTNWWANLLYINNFYRLNEPCLEHCWYLATDMQFYILSPIIFYPMWRWPLFGLIINGIFLLTSIVTPAALGVSYDLLPTSLPFADGMRLFESFKMSYVTPYCRMGPYCLGMALGYMITTKQKVQLSRVVQAFLWCASLALTSSVMFGVYSWNSGTQHSSSLNAFYLSTHRTAWALGIAWLSYACLNGYGGIVNRILSWKAFVVIARLTYVAYLIHVFVLRSFSGLMGDRLVFSHFIWIVIILGVITMTFSLSFLAVLCVEMPFQQLEQLLWPSHRSSASIVKRPSNAQDQTHFNEDSGHVNKGFNDGN